MGDVAKTLGTGQTIEYKGKPYRLAPLTHYRLAEFETWLEGRAWQAAFRSQRFLSEDEYQRRLDAVNRDIAAGVYSFGSERWNQAATSAPGVKYLLYLMLKDNHPEVDEDFVDEMFAANADELLAVMDSLNSDPKASPGAGSEPP